MDRLILFCVGAILTVLSEIFWMGESRFSSALCGGLGMLLLRRMLLRFPYASRALLCILGAVLLAALRYVLQVFSDRNRAKGGSSLLSLWLSRPSFSYALYRFLLIAPAYTIIEYLEARFGM